MSFPRWPVQLPDFPPGTSVAVSSAAQDFPAPPLLCSSPAFPGPSLPLAPTFFVGLHLDPPLLRSSSILGFVLESFEDLGASSALQQLRLPVEKLQPALAKTSPRKARTGAGLNKIISFQRKRKKKILWASRQEDRDTDDGNSRKLPQKTGGHI